HAEEVARGGVATVDKLRIRCRAHNRYTAELAFGKEFMDQKIREARERAAEARSRKRCCVSTNSPAPERVEGRAATNRSTSPTRAPSPDHDVTPWLRELGVHANEARRMAEICEETMPDASLEERLKRALSYLAPRPR